MAFCPQDVRELCNYTDIIKREMFCVAIGGVPSLRGRDAASFP